MKKVVYIDMDNVIVNFQSGIDQLSPEVRKEYEGRLDEVPNIFSTMLPNEGAIEAVRLIAEYYDVYVLSTAPWNNPSAWIDKVEWIQKYFGKDENSPLYKRLILSHHKNLNSGSIIIDDRTANGVDQFLGLHIQFGNSQYPDWESVLRFLIPTEQMLADIAKVKNLYQS